MAKTTSMILGLAFLALGILGITGLVPIFTSDLIYVNIGEIVLGGLGLLIGIYARQGRNFSRRTNDLSHQSRDNAEMQRQEIDKLKKLLEQQKEENEARQQQETEKLKKLLEQQQQENEARQQQETELLKNRLEQQQEENERLRKQNT